MLTLGRGLMAFGSSGIRSTTGHIGRGTCHICSCPSCFCCCYRSRMLCSTCTSEFSDLGRSSFRLTGRCFCSCCGRIGCCPCGSQCHPFSLRCSSIGCICDALHQAGYHVTGSLACLGSRNDGGRRSAVCAEHRDQVIRRGMNILICRQHFCVGCRARKTCLCCSQCGLGFHDCRGHFFCCRPRIRIRIRHVNRRTSPSATGEEQSQ